MAQESKFKVPRSVEEITGEFQQLCLKSGDLQYKIDTLKRDLAMLNEQMRDLNFEFVQRREMDAKAAQEAEEAKKALENNVVPLEEANKE